MAALPFRSVAIATLVGRGLLLVAAAVAVRVGTIEATADLLFTVSLARLVAPLLSVGSKQVPITARVETGPTGRSAISAACGVAAVTLVASLGLGLLLGPSAGWQVAFIIVTVGGTAARTAAVGALRGADRLVLAAVIDGLVFSSALCVGLGVPLALGSPDMEPTRLLGVAAAASLLAALSALAAAVVTSHNDRLFTLPGRWYLAAGLSFVGLGLGSLASGQMFTVLGRWLVDASAFTVFALAIRSGALVAMPLEIASGVVPTKVANAAAADELPLIEDSLRRIATAATLGGLLLLLPVVGVFWLTLTPELRDTEALVLLSIVALGQLVNVWSGNCTMLLSFSGRRRTAVVAVWSAVVVGAVVGLTLGAAFGVYGLAIGAAVTVATNNGLCLVAGRRDLGMVTTASFGQLRNVFGWLTSNITPRARHA